MSIFTVSGRVVDPAGRPVVHATVSVHEFINLSGPHPQKGTFATTDESGHFSVTWPESAARTQTWDIFVRATLGEVTVESPLISDLESFAKLDLVLGAGVYRGRSEWERIADKLAPLLQGTFPNDIPATSIEWLARRADVFPTLLAAYVQAHRLADQRTIQARSCYAFLRGGLPNDLPGLLAAGPAAWEAALRNAWARQIIPLPEAGTSRDRDAELEREREAMRALVVEAAVSRGDALNHRKLFDALAITEAHQREFMSLWTAHEGPTAAFWQAVGDALGPTCTADFQFAIQAALLTGNHIATLAALAAERTNGTITHVAELAAWSADDWERALTEHDVEPPAHAQGEDVSSRRRAHARALTRVLEDSYPSAFVRHALTRDEHPNTTHVAAFLADNPSFDLTRTTIARHLHAADDPWRSVAEADRPLARANLERVQRVYRLAPRLGRYDTAKALLDHGIHAATDIVAFTRTEFVDAFAQLLPSEHHDPLALAGGVWDAASQIHANALALASQLGLASSGADFQPLVGVDDFALAQAGEGLDSLAAILGSLDYCACSHCRSVLSPAAYLADLLGFLDDRPASVQSDALAVLRQRRPDLEHILLDCPNTNTPLPYIDLVNELLERMLAGNLGPSSYQTTATVDELRLHPEHVDAQLYEASPLTTLAHPWVLPFSLPVLESRLYLDRLGASRAELMRLLGVDSQLAIAAERLGMSEAEATLIATASNDAREAWGFAPDADDWVEHLAHDIGDLLRRGEYELDELRELLSLTFVDPHHYAEQGAIELEWSDTCALADASIVNLDAAALDRLHRFTRLARRTKVPPRMLAVLIDDGALDDALLLELADIIALQRRFGRPFDELATWWSTVIDAREYADGEPSLYQRRFLTPSAPAAFQPTSPRGDQINGAEQLTPDTLPTALAATQCSIADYEQLRAAGLIDDALSFASLTRLFAITSLCRALGSSVAEFIALRELTQVDPFTDPAATRTFVAHRDDIRRAGLTIAELGYLLRHDGTPLTDDATLSATLTELARGLAKIDDETPGDAGLPRKRALLLDTAARAFALSPAVAEALLFELLHVVDGDAPLAHAYAFAESFADAAQLDAGIDALTHPEQFLGWRRIAKAAVLVTRHRMSADDLRWTCGGLDGAWLHFDALPLRSDDPDASFTAWDRLRAALALRPLPHAAIASAPSLTAAIEQLAEAGAWSPTELQFVVDQLGFTTVTELVDERNLARLQTIATTGSRIGVTLDLLWSWIHAAPTLAKSAEIAAAARAQHEPLRWRELELPLRDAIRSAQRDALVAAVLATNDTLSTPAQLYEHLLLDTQMSPCMLSSRINAAIGAVQTFINRMFLQLESDAVTFKSDAVQLWSWMRSYRLWEANRKVFLYPENWLAPELRPDKTPLFEQLETTLLQDTLEPAQLERAIAGYLDGLERIAKLEVTAIHQRFDELWLLGRTQNNPRQWFCRRRSKTKQWEPWEELPGQIDSDNVVLVARDGRVQLYWLTILEAKDHGFVPVDDSGYNAHRFAISWMQRTDQGWSRSEVSPNSGIVPKPWGPDARPYMLRSFNLDDEVRLIVYRQSIANSVAPIAEFRHDLRARHVAYVGMHFDGDAFADVLTPQGQLEKNHWIGLQPDYRFEGQRFVKIRLNDTPGGQDNILDIGLADAPLPDAATSFVQGQHSAVVFRRALASGYRSMLHASDYWGLDPSKTWLPVVYDDRRHAYLLEPSPLAPNAAAEGDALSPKLLGTFEVAPYFGCVQFNPPKSFEATPPLKLAQKLKDGVVEPKVWPVGVPGLIAGLHPLEGVGDVYAPPAFAKALLGEAKALIGANAGLLAPNDVLQPEPGALSLRMQSLHHPHASTLVERALGRGVDGLYRPNTQDPLFRQQLAPTIDPMSAAGLDLDDDILRGPAPSERLEFGLDSAFGRYNWELFFHAPMLIAAKLRADRQWSEAQRWFHTIFDPIEVVDLPGETAASKFWRFAPFVAEADGMGKNQLLTMLGIDATPSEQQAAIAAFEQQVVAWRQNPFDPHALARIRPGVYQRNLLMRYLDNLIDWADHLFRRDSLESTQDATLLYVLVGQLLGPRPQQVPGPDAPAKSYHQLAADGLDALQNAAQQLENWVLLPDAPAKTLGCGADKAPNLAEPLALRFWYFCYPPNPELLKYWDIIEDRLWKLRHCRNIDGRERQLPLFDPPIDPGLLVQAKAAGVDLASVLGDHDAGLPPYRFRFVHARATNVCASLRNLGAALLSAIEKRDAEALARVRSEHELGLLAAIRDVRRRQLDELEASLDSLRLARINLEQRRDYFDGLLTDGLSGGEAAAQMLSLEAGLLRAFAQGAMATAGLFYLVPDITVSVGTDTSTKTTHGGSYIGAGLRAIAEYTAVVPLALEAAGAWISSNAAYDRRTQEWTFQRDQAEGELARIDRELAAAKIRLVIAERELANHELQIEQSREVEQFLREKFSNRELYDWMLGQLSALYFQTYQLAFDLAKRAERAYQHELAIRDAAPIIRYGHWDGLRKGLLAGERLGLELERLDIAYMDRDLREFELRKNVSLAQLAPERLRALQETGTCEFELPEVLFDLDHPGHYLRRLRGVRLTVPAVVDATTSLGATLRLLAHQTRVEPSGEYTEQPPGADPRFDYGLGGRMIATSTGVSDGGTFDFDFRDERYLPFEYAGAISRWKLELPNRLRQFDYRTITDVIVHLDYTARGDDQLRELAEQSLVDRLHAMLDMGQPLALLLRVAGAFPEHWQRFLAPVDGQHVLTLPLTPEHFPHFARADGFAIAQLGLTLLLDGPTELPNVAAQLDAVQGPSSFTQASGDAFMTASFALPPATPPSTWTLTIAAADVPEQLLTDGAINPAKLRDLLLVARYMLDGAP